MNSAYPKTTPALRRFNPSHALIWVGVALTVVLVMLRPAGAQALLPSSVLVYVDNTATSDSFNVTVDGKPTITRDYGILLKGKTSPTTISLTGVPLTSILGDLGTKLDVTKVPYVKIRTGSTDANMVLIALNGGPDPSQTPPPMIMTQGEKPGTGSFPTPAIVPGQPTGDAISEEFGIFPFSHNAKLQIVPMQGSIFRVKISHKRTSKGEIKFSAQPIGAPSGAALSYHWLSNDGKTARDNLSTTSSWITDDARTNTGQHWVRVVVTATDGSTATTSASYVSNRSDNGATKDPGYGNGNGNGSTNGTGPGTGPGATGPVNTAPPLTTPTPPVNPSPSPTPAPTPTPTPTAPTTKPPTTTTQTTVDNSGLANVAQNYTSGSPLTTISGVLLSSPTVAPSGGQSGGGGGASPGLTPLQQSAASLAESIFKPVQSPRDLWPYLVTLLFALGLTGGVREWMNP